MGSGKTACHAYVIISSMMNVKLINFTTRTFIIFLLSEEVHI